MYTFFSRTFELNSIYFPIELKTTKSQTLFYILHYSTQNTKKYLQFEYIFFQAKKNVELNHIASITSKFKLVLCINRFNSPHLSNNLSITQPVCFAMQYKNISA